MYAHACELELTIFIQPVEAQISYINVIVDERFIGYLSHMTNDTVIHSMDINTARRLVARVGSVAVTLMVVSHKVCQSRNRLLKKSMAQA